MVVCRVISCRNNLFGMWRLWARALGEKIGEDNKRADRVAFIRTIIILQAIVTNVLIAINIIINWL